MKITASGEFIWRHNLRRFLGEHCAQRALCLASPHQSYSCRRRAPLVRWNHHILALTPLGVTKGKKVGVIGLGGLGHMGVKLAHAFGAHVAVFTTSHGKIEDALRLGVDEVVVSSNGNAMQIHAGSFDFILDTVSAAHDINAYVNLLRQDGNLTLVGAPEKPLEVSAFLLIFGRRSFSNSLIGGITETQEMLDFRGKIISPPMSKLSLSGKPTKHTNICSSPM